MRVRFRCDPALLGHVPPPVPARAALPDWLRTMPAIAASELHGGPVRTVKHCPPFVDAMAHGFVIPLPCDVRIEGGRLSWDWGLPTPSLQSHPRSPLSFHPPAQVEGSPFHGSGCVIVKFNSFWTVELPPGWSLFATHPVNRDDLPFRLLTGLVDADRFSAVGILFPAVWRDPGFEGLLPRGTPVAHCFPVPREPLELDVGPLDLAGAGAYEDAAHALLSKPGVYRRLHRARRGRSGGVQRATQGAEVEPQLTDRLRGESLSGAPEAVGPQSGSAPIGGARAVEVPHRLADGAEVESRLPESRIEGQGSLVGRGGPR